MKPVILLVDDEPDLLQVLAEAIGMALPRYEVISSTSLEQAERALTEIEQRSAPLSLVVVDHILGDRTGLEFLEQLRTQFPDVPSMLFTGKAPPQVEERAAQVGARVLWKPLRLRTWLGEVESLLA